VAKSPGSGADGATPGLGFKIVGGEGAVGGGVAQKPRSTAGRAKGGGAVKEWRRRC
jgi:hypothetical protein